MSRTPVRRQRVLNITLDVSSGGCTQTAQIALPIENNQPFTSRAVSVLRDRPSSNTSTADTRTSEDVTVGPPAATSPSLSVMKRDQDRDQEKIPITEDNQLQKRMNTDHEEEDEASLEIVSTRRVGPSTLCKPG